MAIQMLSVMPTIITASAAHDSTKLHISDSVTDECHDWRGEWQERESSNDWIFRIGDDSHDEIEG